MLPDNAEKQGNCEGPFLDEKNAEFLENQRKSGEKIEAYKTGQEVRSVVTGEKLFTKSSVP